MSQSKNILFLLSGSIAIPKAVTFIKQLISNGFIIKIACTETTFNFVSKNELETLTNSPVIYKNFQNKLDMEHIDLGRWADLTILCPGTANTINQFAQGVADNIVGTLFLAYELGKKPFLIAPAMNTQMYNNPATQSSLKKLKSWGLDVLPTDIGLLACGEFGEGRLLEPNFLFNYINNNYFSTSETYKILITSGATTEPIDGVRYITNFSTGKTGAKIADNLTQNGFDVTLLKAQRAQSPKYTKKINNFTDFNSLNTLLKAELESNYYDAVIMTAAISDFSVDSIKINNVTNNPDKNIKISSKDQLSIQLKKNFKIISKLKSYSKNKSINIIAFKLTKTNDQESIKKSVKTVSTNDGVQLVVQNDLLQIESGTHQFNVYQNNKLKQSNLQIFELSKIISNNIKETKKQEINL